MELTLDQAKGYADKALGHARSIGASVSVAVVDEFGLLVQMDRLEGAQLMSPDIAEAKALTALNFKRSTSSVAQDMKADPTVYGSLRAIVHFQLMPVGGGLPILDGADAVVGAIGVSGGISEQDEQIAKAALG